jgi:hypothetical protein
MVGRLSAARDWHEDKRVPLIGTPFPKGQADVIGARGASQAAAPGSVHRQIDAPASKSTGTAAIVNNRIDAGKLTGPH